MTLIEETLIEVMKERMKELPENKQISTVTNNREASQMFHDSTIKELKGKNFKDFVNSFELEKTSRMLTRATCSGIADRTKRIRCVSEDIEINKEYDEELIKTLNEACK